MATIETKYNIGQKVIQFGSPATIKGIEVSIEHTIIESYRIEDNETGFSQWASLHQIENTEDIKVLAAEPATPRDFEAEARELRDKWVADGFIYMLRRSAIGRFEPSMERATGFATTYRLTAPWAIRNLAVSMRDYGHTYE